MLRFRQLRPEGQGCPICNNGVLKLAFFASERLTTAKQNYIAKTGKLVGPLVPSGQPTSTDAWQKRLYKFLTL